MPEIDTSDAADARRFRWIIDGNGYFMEENMICGHSSTSDKEKNDCRDIIDIEISQSREG